MTETPSPNPTPKPPTILDRVKRPAGVLPKNIQIWVILGVALLMIAILALDAPQTPFVESFLARQRRLMARS